MKNPGLVIVAVLALAIGSVSTWVVSRATLWPDDDSVVTFCEVNASTAADRGLSEGVFVNGTDSGCVPSELRFCVETRDSVLDLRRC